MFLIQNFHCANKLFSKRSVLFARDIEQFYGTAATLNKKDLLTDLEAVLDKSVTVKMGKNIFWCHMTQSFL